MNVSLGLAPHRGLGKGLCKWRPLTFKLNQVCWHRSPQKGIPWWLSGKEISLQCRRHKRRGFNPWVKKIPWRRQWLPTPVFLPGEFHVQRSLVSYSPWGCKESDMTEWLTLFTPVYLAPWGDQKWVRYIPDLEGLILSSWGARQVKRNTDLCDLPEASILVSDPTKHLPYPGWRWLQLRLHLFNFQVYKESEKMFGKKKNPTCC